MAAVAKRKAYRGPAILSYGFRPFFLLGSLHAGLAVLLWLPIITGHLHLISVFAARDWHVHEMLYGFVPAVAVGFLLTAIPNWTGRLPIQGGPLLVLVATWIAGRIVVGVGAQAGWLVVLMADSAFLMLMVAVVMREILAGRNWRNLPVAALLGLFAAGNVAFHLEAHLLGSADISVRVGLATTIMLIMLIGGRIIPSFTRNWLVRVNPGRLPVAHNRFDVAAVVVGGLALVTFVARPAAEGTAMALLVAGVLHAARLARWAGDRTLADRLVLILHIGYAFVPAGFILLGLATLVPLPSSAGIHAWSTGAAGVMTLAVMTRASLGHTGHALVADTVTQSIYAAVVAGALARIAAAFAGDWALVMLSVSAIAWSAAFLGFSIAFGPLLCRSKPI